MKKDAQYHSLIPWKNRESFDTSRKFHFILPVAGLAGLVVILVIILAPPGLSLYYQVQGGQIVDRILASTDPSLGTPIACDISPVTDEKTKEELKQALTYLEKANKYNPQASQAYLLQGRAYCLLGEQEKAIKSLLAYTHLRPENPLGHLELGFLYAAVNNPDPALHEWKTAGITVQDFINVGQQAKISKHYDAALRWFTHSLVFKSSRALILLNIGEVYESTSQIEKAQKAFQEAYEINPEISTTALALNFEKKGQFKDAKELLLGSLNKFPHFHNRLEWWQNLGNLYENQKDWSNAVQVYQDAIQEYPDEVELHVSLGKAYYENGDGIEKAVNELKQAIELDRSNAGIYLAIGQIYILDEKYDEAIYWFDLAIERNPNNPNLYLSKANALRDGNHLNSALDFYQELITHFPDYAPAYYDLAWVYYLNNQTDKSIQAIQKAISLMNTPKPWYYIRAGLIYEKFGDYKEAKTAYQQALEIDPTLEYAIRSLKRLEDSSTP